MILPFTRFNQSIWKKKFQNISAVTPEIKKLISDMKETLEITSGVGLAAPQVGAPYRIFITNYGKLKETFINPKMIRYGKESDELEEGCLSVPCVRGATTRPTEVEIEYLDEKGLKKRKVLTGYYARIAQHEYDHLSSTFYINRIIDKKKIYKYDQIRLVFFGTPDFGAVVLKALIGQQLAGEYKIELVVTAPDKPAGRGRQTNPSPVKELAEQFNLQITEKNPKELINQLKIISPDFLVLASYGKILPKSILSTAKKAPLNVHPSLLPKYRGSSPIQTAIANGDQFTGVTIMKMNEKMDEGDILASARVRIGKKDTYGSLKTKLAEVGALLTHQVLHVMNMGEIKPRPQISGKATYTKKLTREDGFIDWKKPPVNLDNLIGAYHPWPGVWTYYQGSGIRDQESGKNSKSKMQKAKILKLLPGKKVQLEGKETVKLEVFKQGHKDFDLEW